MDPRLLRYYKQELEFVREMGAEFATEYPKIAGRLGLSGLEVGDPYVERLLEGFAFLTARVQLKLDSEFPRLTHHLLDCLFPNYLAPIPSMAVVQMQPAGNDPALAAGVRVPRGSTLRSLLGKGDQTACVYRTAHDVVLWPLQITEAGYMGSPRDLAAFGLPEVANVRAGMRLRLQTTGKATFGKLPMRSLPLFLQGPEDLPMRVHEQLLANTLAVIVRPATKTPAWQRRLPDGAVRPVGFRDEESLLPRTLRGFHGHRLLQEYFAFPERFRAVELAELDGVLRDAGDARELDVFFLFDRGATQLENNIDATRFQLFTTPVVNLFEKRCDRIHLDPAQSDYHVVPDRSRPLDFEVHSVQRVVGQGSEAQAEQPFRPLYGTDDQALPGIDDRYYTLDRRLRRQPETQRGSGPRSSYVGSEVFLTITDTGKPPYDPDLTQLEVNALCSNRDLPLLMPLGTATTDFTLEATAPLQTIRCVAGPTRPKPSLALGETSWRLIDHLSLNFVTLLDQGSEHTGQALRELLALHGDMGDPHAQKLVQGVRSANGELVVRHLPTPGPLAFGRGLRIRVECDESQFEGSGVYLLGCVLERFFARMVSLNSFTETVLATVERGEIARWAPRIGNRQLL